MLRLVFQKILPAGLLMFSSQFAGQAQTIQTSAPGSYMTTGIVGLTATQTARLNVLNLQPIIPGVAAVACPATLEFYDDTGAQVKQLAVANIAPATATSLVFKPPVFGTSNARSQIRAVVFTPSSGNLVSGPMVLPIRSGCSVMASLEIIDDSTGVTSTIITDLRSMPSYNIMPMMTGR